MPEGHSIRHFANIYDRWFVGSTISATSPQGRFSEGASAIDGQVMRRTSAHGKHLFLHFDTGIVHIHLGLYGWFKFSTGVDAPVGDAVRLRLATDHDPARVADLSGPTTCELLADDEDLYDVVAKLGPDPLHHDADYELVWNRIKKSNKPIASLLMDQSIIAGIGNVYRAEILFVCVIDPFKAGKHLLREEFDLIWQTAARMLEEGSVNGQTYTVLPQHLTDAEKEMSHRVQTSYVYKRTGQACRICLSTVQSDQLEGRTLYWCPCQTA